MPPNLFPAHQVIGIHLYPNYVAGSIPKKDIALVRLETVITFSHKVFPACIHNGNFPIYETAVVSNVCAFFALVCVIT